MSDKSHVTESSTSADPLQLALKKVYSLHKEKVKELADERDDFKDGCEVLLQHKNRLLEKARSLQNQNEILCNENTRLRNLLDSVRSEGGRGSSRCETCDHLQRSLSAIQEAYKHSLDEKEKMIHYLEERVAELSRQSSPFNKQPELNLSGLLTPDKSMNEGGGSRPLDSCGKSPLTRGEQAGEKTASKKILDAVTNRLGRESTQDDDVLDDDEENQKKMFREASSEKIEENIQFDDSGYFGIGSLRKHGTKAVTCSKKSENARYVKTREYQLESDQNKIRSLEERRVGSEVNNIEDRNSRNLVVEKNEAKHWRERTDSTVHQADQTVVAVDKGSPETLRQRRLGLGRKQGKRSRYTEDSPPGKKKPKFDKSHTQNTSDESDVPLGSIHHSSKSRVLVQETCDPDSDRTVSMSSEGSPDKFCRGRKDSVDCVLYPEYAVVPETLGMGMTSSDSESEENQDTQDTVKARSESGSPGQVLHSPHSQEDLGDELGKFDDHQSRKNQTSKLRTERNDQQNAEKETRYSAGILHTEKTGVYDTCDSKDRYESRPTSPVFSGGKGFRRNVESPFLFDDDGPGSSKSNRRRSLNVSGLASDQESPLLLRPVCAGPSSDCGQSPLLKETSSKIDAQKDTESVTNSKCPLSKSQSLQDNLERTQRALKLRNSEKLKQTTLSQAFVPSPPSLPYLNLSPTKPEEKAAIDKAIRLSLQEIDNNREIIKTKQPLFGRLKHKQSDAELTENIHPLFKRPPSPDTLKSPSKKKSPKKKISPNGKIGKCKKDMGQKDDVIDLDETVPPNSRSLQDLTKQFSPVDTSNKGETTVNMLNQSLDPDLSLTQYCSDTELHSQRHRTRHSRGKFASQKLDTQSDNKVKIGTTKNSERTSQYKKRALRRKELQQTNSNCSEEGSSQMKSSPSVSTVSHFTPNDGVSLGNDFCQVSSGRRKPSSSVEIVLSGSFQDLDEEDGEDQEADVTLDPKFMRAHMYEGQVDESQSIPLSSCSYKFGSVKSRSGSSQEVENEIKGAVNVEDEEENTLTDGNDRRMSFNDSFDRVPKKADVSYAHVNVVRKQADRQKLKATTCQECYDYYKSKGCSEEEIQQQIQDCSRHRARHLPPSTPEHFWSIGFPDTQECVQRGYISVESPSKRKPGHRRRRKLAMRFKSRQEEEDNSQDDI